MPKWSDQRIYQEFIKKCDDIKIQGETIVIQLKKKRSLPLIIEKMSQFGELKYHLPLNKKIRFGGATYSLNLRVINYREYLCLLFKFKFQPVPRKKTLWIKL